MKSKDTFSASMSRINVKQTRVSFSSLPRLGQVSDTIASRSTGDIPLDADSLKVLIIQNDLLCNPCTAIQSLIEFDITYHVIYAFHDNALKSVHPLLYEAIIILGGRHGAYEETEWLKKEKEFIRKALKLDVPILGICLGCQLLAECVGGKVYAATKGIEIGYKFWKYHSEETDKHIQTEQIQKKIKYKTKECIPTEPTSSESKEGEHEDCIDFFEEDLDFDGNNDDVKNQEIDDPFVQAFEAECRDRFVILFHGDTFDVPPKCVVSKKDVKILASTDKYTSLFRVGQYSC